MNTLKAIIATALSATMVSLSAAADNSSYPVPENVKAVKAGTNVTVSWDAPVVSNYEPTLEDFESYNAYETKDLGKWTLIDLDGNRHQFYYDIDFNNDPQAMDKYMQLYDLGPHSWMTYGDQLFRAPHIAPVSGKNVLSAWVSFGSLADDWAISPELSGESQTIRFKGKGINSERTENFSIYYSTGSKEPADFVLIATKKDVGNEWGDFSFDVPEGAKYFAFHYCGDLSKNYGLAIDDIEYYAAGQVKPELLGFNVYRDGVKLNSEVINDVSFTDNDASGEDHVYNVTAVYTAGESPKSADCKYEYVPDYDLNLAIEGFATPEALVAGKKATFTVSVLNDGRKASGQFKVVFTENGETVASKDEKSLNTGETRDIVFEVLPDAFYAAENVYSAEVVLEGDERIENNRTDDVKLMFATAEVPAPKNFEGKVDGDNIVLSWEAPMVSNPEPTLEDFESYNAYETKDLGKWTLIDLDGNRHQFYYDMDFDNDPQAMDKYMQLYDLGPHSWMTYGDQLFRAPHIAPVSGKNVLSAWVSFGSLADDWAISPELSGESQTIRFKGKGINSERTEDFSIYYSTGSKEPADFVLIATKKDVGNEWGDFSFDVPEGAKYFAFHYCGNLSKNYGLAIDDIEYYAAGQVKPELLGFNIYRDGVKLNDAPVNDVAYTDNGGARESHKYHATALYNIGESALAGPFVNTVVGLENVDASGIAIAAVEGGIAVEGVCGTVEVYSVDGRLVATAAGDGIIPVANGLYVVKAGLTTAKVLVK